MKMNETVAGLTITAKTEGVDQAKKQVDSLTQSTEKLGVVSETASKGASSLETQWKRATLRFDEAARAQANIEQQTKLANKAVEQGTATRQQADEHLARVAQRYATAGTATEKFTQQTGLARHELINLGRQAQDVGVSLLSGQSPFTVLAQQGTQIADVFISSGKSVGSFFSQAIGWAGRFLTSTAGIVTAIAAIGVGAIYMASQFVRGTTTVQQALEEQKRLLNETRTAVNDLIDAQVKLRSMDIQRFQTLENEKDLLSKVITSMKEIATLAASRVATPTGGGMPEMGIAPTGFAAPGTRITEVGEGAQTATLGVQRLVEAIQTLNIQIDAGQPNMVNFINILGQIGSAHPELADTISRLAQLAQEGVKVETAWLKAGAALRSVAQINLANLQQQQGAEAAERMAQAVLQMAAAYPGMSIEVAKQLNDLEGQLIVEQTRTGVERMIAQELVTQVNLQMQGKTLEEAIALAAKQRAITQEQINANAEERLKDLQNEYELIKATSAEERSRIAARQEYDKLVGQGVDPSKASAIASQMTANARATEEMARGTRHVADNIGDANDETKSWSAQMDDANDAINRVTNSTYRAVGAAQTLSERWAEITIASDIAMDMMGPSQFKAGGYEIGLYTGTQSNKAALERTYGAENVEAYTSGTGSAQTTKYRVTQNYLDEQLKTGGGKYAELLKQQIAASKNVTTSMDKLTGAVESMTDVLSPYYSTDPRETHLGFRSFAGGGIMTPYGELPLRQYQGGGVATSPQVAVYGEGSTPEAYVPVPSGRIPVELKMPANSNRPVVVNIRVMGNADASTVQALKSTAFQQAQSMRRAMR